MARNGCGVPIDWDCMCGLGGCPRVHTWTCVNVGVCVVELIYTDEVIECHLMACEDLHFYFGFSLDK